MEEKVGSFQAWIHCGFAFWPVQIVHYGKELRKPPGLFSCFVEALSTVASCSVLKHHIMSDLHQLCPKPVVQPESIQLYHVDLIVFRHF